jgi:hypothetical protein
MVLFTVFFWGIAGLYWRADPDHARNGPRQASCGPPDRDPAFGVWPCCG